MFVQLHLTPCISKHKRPIISTALCLVILLFWGNSVKIYAKAFLAKGLIAYAWHQTIADQQRHKPWPWADTWPVGKIFFPRLGKTRYILAGGQGASLAFGPGLLDGTAKPSERGTKIIGGHRDTHFSFLKGLEIGDIFLLQGDDGKTHYYQLDSTHIVDSRTGEWRYTPEENEVHLITCYPFDSMRSGGPLRFVAIAKPKFVKSEKTGTNNSVI